MKLHCVAQALDTGFHTQSEKEAQAWALVVRKAQRVWQRPVFELMSHIDSSVQNVELNGSLGSMKTAEQAVVQTKLLVSHMQRESALQVLDMLYSKEQWRLQVSVSADHAHWVLRLQSPAVKMASQRDEQMVFF